MKNTDKNEKIAQALINAGVPSGVARKAFNQPLSDLLAEIKEQYPSSFSGVKNIEGKARAEAIVREKGKRFTISSRLLTGQEITCKVIKDAKQMPASYDLGTKELMLNEALPNARNEVEALTYDRGKLFHEVSHAKWTGGSARQEIIESGKVTDVQAFLDMSNFIEDGRIERLAKNEWNGSGNYLDALLDSLVDSMDSEPIGALPVYVRTGLWRNKADEKFWAPYKDRIDAGIVAKDTDEVCRLAQSIVNEMCAKKDQQEKQPQPDKEGEGKGEGEGQSNSEGDSKGEGKSGKASGDQEKKEEQESKGEMASGVRDALKDMAEKAKDLCRVESQETLDSIIDAVENDKQEQEYSDTAEENIADELATMLRSLLTEQSRKKFSSSREGLLNTSALVRALTNRRCFHVKEKALGVPHVALLLDTSGSMRSSADALTTAARIINGALQKTGIASKVVSFNSHSQIEPVVTITPLYCTGGTNMAEAMDIANTWFETEQAERPLMVAITDGASDNIKQVKNEKQRCQDSNGFVLGVMVGDIAKGFASYDSAVREHFTCGFHETAMVPDVSRLPDALEPKLLEYISGS